VTASTVLLPGVDRHGAGYRVPMRFGAHRHIETGIATPDEANARVITLRAMRDAGLTPAAAPRDQTLRAAAEALLTRKHTTVSRKTKRKLRRRGIEWWVRATKPWREGELAEVPISLLDRSRVEDYIVARAATAAKTARDELDGLKATLRLASTRNLRYDPALLEIERPVVTPRQRRALTVAELELLAEKAPSYARRMLLFKGTVGNRFEELATLTDDRVDLGGATIFIPAHLCKEGEDKTIDLTLEEVALLRRQLLERARGTRLVFPTKTADSGGTFSSCGWSGTRRGPGQTRRGASSTGSTIPQTRRFFGGSSTRTASGSSVTRKSRSASASTRTTCARQRRRLCATRVSAKRRRPLDLVTPTRASCSSGSMTSATAGLGCAGRSRRSPPRDCARRSPRRRRDRLLGRPRRARRTCRHRSPGPIRVQPAPRPLSRSRSTSGIAAKAHTGFEPVPPP
jgi:hypothetical protein